MRGFKRWSGVANWAAQAWPRRCLLCEDGPADVHSGCCALCWQGVPWRQQTLHLSALSVHAVAHYQWPVDRLIHLYKYQSQLQFLPVLVALLATFAPPSVAAIAPVPLAPERLRERGFDQCALLAHALASHWGLPVWRGLRRIRHTARQQQLSASARQHNLQGAFAIDPQQCPPDRVLLLDDVLTTGSTLIELSGLLHQHGVTHVHALVLASNHR